eukprot:3666108-Amphidinium_carterae.1
MEGRIQALTETTQRQTPTSMVMQPLVDTKILNKPKTFSGKARNTHTEREMEDNERKEQIIRMRT